jgi:hypothetical protein
MLLMDKANNARLVSFMVEAPLWFLLFMAGLFCDDSAVVKRFKALQTFAWCRFGEVLAGHGLSDLLKERCC